MNFTCPNCGLENAYFELVGAKGAHYACPDCDYEWVDRTVTAYEDDELDEEEIDEENDHNRLLKVATLIIESTNI